MSNVVNLRSNSEIDLTTSNLNNTADSRGRRRRSPSRNSAPGPSRRRSRSRNSSFTNIITMERTPRSRGMILNTQPYDVQGLANMILANIRAGRRESRVPHTRNPITAEQMAEIRRRTSTTRNWSVADPPAAAPHPFDFFPGGRFAGQQHPLVARPVPAARRAGGGLRAPPYVPPPPLYIRRHLPSGNFKFFKIVRRPANVEVSELVTRTRTAGVRRMYLWRLSNAQQDNWSDKVLTLSRARVDFSTDFTLPDQGNWVSVRSPDPRSAMNRFQRGDRVQFMSALATQIPLRLLDIIHPRYHP